MGGTTVQLIAYAILAATILATGFGAIGPAIAVGL
jgi:hypothetical protein